MLIKMEEIRKSIGTAEGLGEKFSGADFISSANELLMLAQEALDMNNLGRFRLQPAVRGDHGALLLKITEKGHPESDYIDYRKYKTNISYLFEYLYWKLSGKPNDQKTLVKVKSDLDRLVSERYERNLQKRLREEKEKERIEKQKYLSKDQLRNQVENSSNGTIYLVGIRRKTKVVRLVAYRGRDLEDNRKTGVGLSYQDILGGYDYEPVYQSPSKEKCIKYIKSTFDGSWSCYDDSDSIKKLSHGKKMHSVVQSRVTGELDIVEYHTGNRNARTPYGYEVVYESTRIADCRKFIKEYYRAQGQGM